MAKAGDRSEAPLDAANAERLRIVLLGYLAHRSGDRALAEDLTQEAMVHVVQDLPEFRGAADLRTWARRVALNVWHDHLRRQSANPTERAASGDQFSVGALLDSIGPRSPAPAPDDAYDRRVTHDCLIAAARRLPLAEREIILLHDFGVIALERAALRSAAPSAPRRFVYTVRAVISRSSAGPSVRANRERSERSCAPRKRRRRHHRDRWPARPDARGGIDHGRVSRCEDAVARRPRRGDRGEVSALLHDAVRHRRQARRLRQGGARRRGDRNQGDGEVA